MPNRWPVENVRRVPLASLVPYARNPKTHPPAQVELIAKSLERYGQAQVVLIDGDRGPTRGEIIAGHGRVLAAERLGWRDIVVAEARGWTEAKKRAYRVADNELGSERLAPWDRALLAAEVRALAASADGPVELPLLGFDEARLEALLAGGPEAPGEFALLGEDIETQHECPRCHYRWSGAPDAGARGNGG